MEWLINQKKTLFMTIGWRPLMSFPITNNLLTPSIRAINLGISPRAITVVAWNNFENLKDGLLVWSISKDVHKPS